MKFFVILNDGETYTNAEGCKIISVPDYIEDADLDEFIKAGHGRVTHNVEEYQLPATGLSDVVVHRVLDPELVSEDEIQEFAANLEAEDWLADHPEFGS